MLFWNTSQNEFSLNYLELPTPVLNDEITGPLRCPRVGVSDVQECSSTMFNRLAHRIASQSQFPLTIYAARITVGQSFFQGFEAETVQL